MASLIAPNNTMNGRIATTNDILNSSKLEKCENCGSAIFNQGFILRTLSALLSGSGEPMLIPVPVFTCSKCGEIAPIFKDDPKFKTMFNENDN